MADYIALERVALSTGLVEKNTKFSSDAVPGRQWKPVCKDARAAVKARDAAVREAPSPAAGPDPRVAELEAALAEAEQLAAMRDEEIEGLKAQIAKFDGDRDGNVGGSAAN